MSEWQPIETAVHISVLTTNDKPMNDEIKLRSFGVNCEIVIAGQKYLVRLWDLNQAVKCVDIAGALKQP